MDWSTPDLPCPSPTPEACSTHVHRIGDVIQPSHPLSTPSPPDFNPAQHQGLFQWVTSSHQVAKVLEFLLKHQFSSVQLLSRVQLFVTPWTAACQGTMSITNSQSSLKLMFIESAMQSNHLILCRPLLLLSQIPPSIRVFSSESTIHMMWPKIWSFSFSIIPSNEHPGLISFRMDWLDLLPVQGTLKSLLQHHSSKASILQCSAFFTVQLSHPWKNHSLD